MKKSIIATLTALLIACTAGLIACGHTCTFDQKVSSMDTLASVATCTSAAKYYYTCECGEKGTETFTVGQPLPHGFTVEEVKEDALKAPATCLAPAVYYKSCVTCGAISTDDEFTFSSGETLPHVYPASNDFVCINGCGQANALAGLRAENPNQVFFFDYEIGTTQVAQEGRVNVDRDIGVSFDTAKNMTAVPLNNMSSDMGIAIPLSSANFTGFETETQTITEEVDGEQVEKEIAAVIDKGYVQLEVLWVPADGVNNPTYFNLRSKSAAPCAAAVVLPNEYTTLYIPATYFNITGSVVTLGIAEKIQGTLFLGKGVYVPEEEVVSLGIEADLDYTFSGINFKTLAYVTEKGSIGTSSYEVNTSAVLGIKPSGALWAQNGAVHSQRFDCTQYYINGSIVMPLSTRSNMFPSGGVVALKLAEADTLAKDGVMTITSRNAVVSKVVLKNADGTNVELAVASNEAGANGFVTYTTAGVLEANANASYDHIFIYYTAPAGMAWSGGIYAHSTISALTLA